MRNFSLFCSVGWGGNQKTTGRRGSGNRVDQDTCFTGKTADKFGQFVHLDLPVFQDTADQLVGAVINFESKMIFLGDERQMDGDIPVGENGVGLIDQIQGIGEAHGSRPLSQSSGLMITAGLGPAPFKMPDPDHRMDRLDRLGPLRSRTGGNTDRGGIFYLIDRHDPFLNRFFCRTHEKVRDTVHNGCTSDRPLRPGGNND